MYTKEEVGTQRKAAQTGRVAFSRLAWLEPQVYLVSGTFLQVTRGPRLLSEVAEQQAVSQWWTQGSQGRRILNAKSHASESKQIQAGRVLGRLMVRVPLKMKLFICSNLLENSKQKLNSWDTQWSVKWSST